MTQETVQEHVTGRVWTVRLDPSGRPSAGTVRLSCSRRACHDRRFPNAADGRKAAVSHVNMHLAAIRSDGGPRSQTWCACRAADCAWHTPDTDTPRRRGNTPGTSALRCGGPVVLTAHADRAGRLWRIAEVCARCAAATADCRVLDTAPPPPRRAEAPVVAGDGTAAPASEREYTGGTTRRGAAGLFSHTPSPASRPGPAHRGGASARTRGAKRWGKIAQRFVPHDLQPDVLRVELIELGDEYRAYQQRPEPDLAVLAALHERKARAFASWSDVTGDAALRAEARRAEQAARTTRDVLAGRAGGTGDGDGPVVQRLLTLQQAAHARTVLGHLQARTPYPDAEARLAVLLLTLRAARAGTGNLTGQELTGWLQGEAKQVLERLVAADWLRLPGSVDEALASRSENPTPFTVPSLLPEQPTPFAFGKTTRARLSGWAQKVVGDRKIRKKKLGAATRLLAVYTTAHSRPDGSLGTGEERGCKAGEAAAFCGLPSEEVAEHARLLVTADWLTDVETAGGRLHGRLAERVLPLGASL